MTALKTDNSASIPTHYFETMYDGKSARIYLLPGVPTDAGQVPQERSIGIEEALAAMERGLPEGSFGEFKDRTGEMLSMYKGRQMDVMGVLHYAIEQGKFDEYASKLEQKHGDLISRIHPGMRKARTDIEAFFMELYLDLGIAKEEDAKSTIEFNKRNGPGLIVFPNN